jgi:hypothetical protein
VTDRPMRLEQAAQRYLHADPAEVARAYSRRPIRISRAVPDLSREFLPASGGGGPWSTARLCEIVACCPDCGYTYDELMFAAERGWIDHAVLDSRVYLTLDYIEQFKSNPEIGTIYAVGFQRYVKIGFATDVRNRIKGLQTAVPIKLAVYRTFAAHRSYERELHKRFSKHRLHGEWFMAAPEIRQWFRERRG